VNFVEIRAIREAEGPILLAIMPNAYQDKETAEGHMVYLVRKLTPANDIATDTVWRVAGELSEADLQDLLGAALARARGFEPSEVIEMSRPKLVPEDSLLPARDPAAAK
jgi:hypothetical protein